MGSITQDRNLRRMRSRQRCRIQIKADEILGDGKIQSPMIGFRQLCTNGQNAIRLRQKPARCLKHQMRAQNMRMVCWHHTLACHSGDNGTAQRFDNFQSGRASALRAATNNYARPP